MKRRIKRYITRKRTRHILDREEGQGISTEEEQDIIINRMRTKYIKRINARTRQQRKKRHRKGES